MKILLIGASGFIGQPLAAALRGRGDTVLTASLRAGTAPAVAELAAEADAVVNLAGAPVAQRWTAKAKAEIRASRVDRTRELMDAFARMPASRHPRAYVVSSAIGFYGTSDTATFTEKSQPGSDFLAGICTALEDEASRAVPLGMRLATLRIGIVLGMGGGALKPLLPLFRLGLGGPIAGGQQPCSWIHLEDMVRLFVFAIDGANGVLNGTAPAPVPNREFAHAIGRALHRPAILPTPGFAIRLALGDAAIVVTEGQRVLPERTLDQGFTFLHPSLDEALANIFGHA